MRSRSRWSFAPSGWGWTANIPGFGLLADQFKEPALHLWTYDAATLAPAMFGPGARVPLKPFCGHDRPRARRARNRTASCRRAGSAATWTCAISPPAPSSICRSRSPAASSRSATRTPRKATARSAARRSRARCASRAIRPGQGRPPRLPALHYPGPVTRHLDAKGYDVTTGIGPDLMEGARAAVAA